MTNPLLELRALGQSVWLDDIDRGQLRSGQFVQEDKDPKEIYEALAMTDERTVADLFVRSMSGRTGRMAS
jgi:hypothetical protein